MLRSRLVPFILLLSINASRASTSDSIPDFAARAIAKLQSIHSAKLRYISYSKSIMDTKVKQDTISVEFAGLKDSGNLAVVINNRETTVFYKDSSLFWIGWPNKTIFRQIVPQKQILDRLDYWLFWPIMNGGHGLQHYLDSKTARRRIWDTVGPDGITHNIEFVEPNDEPQDTMHGDLKVNYTIDRNDNIVLTKNSGVDFKQYNWNAKQVLQEALNQSTVSELSRIIDSSEKDVSARSFANETMATYKARERGALRVDSVVPDFGGHTPDGDSIRFSSIKSKVVLADFWYTGCGPCRYELPFLRTMQQKYRDKGLTVVGLDPMDEEMSVVKQVIALENLKNPEISISREVADKMFGVTLYPTMFLMDANRKILYTKLGYMKSYEAEIERTIKDALGVK